MSSEFWTEVYDSKDQRVSSRMRSYTFCDECRHHGGHTIECSKCDLEHLAVLLKRSQKSEEVARRRAAEWLAKVRELTGKLAMLRHENNKLRAENRKLKSNK